jgi:nucleotide-binding universal stress UspA family protein
MIEFADQQKSACFVVASNGRSGVQRFILGSFAESLLAHSKQPVLFLNQSNPDDVRDRTLNHALFATDFSDVSKIVFEHFLLQAQRSALEITLFHAVSLPMLAYAGGDVGPNMVPEDFFSTQMKWAADKGAEWLELAKKAGVPANFMLKYEGLAPEMAKVVLAAADEAKAGFIVMASKKTTATSFALGGFSREVFRSRSYPVWMYGPEAIRAIEIKGAN